MTERTRQILIAWLKAHQQAEDNPRLLLLDGHETFGDLCVARMKVCAVADELFYSLDGESDLPEAVQRHFRAQKDKGCSACWLSSIRSRTHRDGTPSCQPKIKEWFDSQEALQAFVATLATPKTP